MNETIINNWNSTVTNSDTVWHLGDFAMAGRDVQQLKKLIERLNGKINLIIGSHEKSAIQLKSLFESVQMCKTIMVKHQKIFMAHHCHKVWDTSHYGTWHLFGHSHGKLDSYAAKEGKLLDVGVDTHDFKLWSFQEIKCIMDTRPLNFNDLRKRTY